MSRKPRRSFTATQKTAILRRHLVDKIPISQVCEEEGIQPSLFYYWQKQLFENIDRALQPMDTARTKELERKVEQLEARLAKKDRVIAQISEDYVELKKSLGSPEWPMGSPRPAGRGRRLRLGPGRAHGAARLADRRLDRHPEGQVLRLEEAIRQGERAQRQDPA